MNVEKQCIEVCHAFEKLFQQKAADSDHASALLLFKHRARETLDPLDESRAFSCDLLVLTEKITYALRNGQREIECKAVRLRYDTKAYLKSLCIPVEERVDGSHRSDVIKLDWAYKN